METGSTALRIALAQINTTVGDVAGNAAKIREWARRALESGAGLVVFPELALSGYPPEDLVLKAHFLEAVGDELDRLASATSGIVALVGFPERRDGAVYNSAAILRDGGVEAVYRKQRLPNYGVFDEKRYFEPGTEPLTVDVAGSRVGITVCEDIWFPGGPGGDEAAIGADLIVNLSASPYHAGKGRERELEVVAPRAREYGAPVALCNLVGGQDELVFDGHSLAVDPGGSLRARGGQFEEELVVIEFEDERIEGSIAADLDRDEEIYRALVTGLRDYVDKNEFERVVVALSGGIDSALVALVAADALDANRLTCVTMPSRYSSEGTRTDAKAIAQNLGARLIELPIERPFEGFEETLAEPFEGAEPDIAEENLQARIRGTLVMALSNKFGWLVLTTGNKSELSVGYATLYGDMAGGFAVLKDVFKGQVYRLVRWRNEREGRELVPASVLERPPSAELRHEQRDEDSLPPYETLDAILAGYIEEDLDAAQLVARGLPERDVERVIALVDAAEYKRRQAPPGIRISTKAFGRDRRLPITNRFRG